MIIRKAIKWIQSLRYYVLMDSGDNGVSLSKHLFRHIKDNATDNCNTDVFVFYIPESDTYGFMQDDGIEQPTQRCTIQYNGKYKCVGFETLCPSVGTILYHYGLPADCRIKLSVSVKRNVLGKIYYQFEKPNAKHIRKYTES